MSQSPSQPRRTVSARGPATRPHISEWFGHRVFPTVAVTPVSLGQQRSGMCPFLSETLTRFTPCVKAENSRGVCTISATSNGVRQDWLVCPYRALDDDLLAGMVRRLYGVPDYVPLLIRPAKALESPDIKEEVLLAVKPEDPQRVFLYFQDKLGGEISLSRTPASPELSFDITVIELLPADPQTAHPNDPDDPGVRVGKYGVIELQTTDTHGSYKHAVSALTSKCLRTTQNGPAAKWKGRTYPTSSSVRSTKSLSNFRSPDAIPQPDASWHYRSQSGIPGSRS